MVSLNCKPILGEKGMVMHAEISEECLLPSKRDSSTSKDSKQAGSWNLRLVWWLFKAIHYSKQYTLLKSQQGCGSVITLWEMWHPKHQHHLGMVCHSLRVSSITSNVTPQGNGMVHGVLLISFSELLRWNSATHDLILTIGIHWQLLRCCLLS